MSDLVRGKELYDELHGLAQTEGNNPILCSRMHFSEWADDVDKLCAEIERLRGTLLWVRRNIDRIKDWQVPGGVELVVDHIRDEIKRCVAEGDDNE